MILETLAKFSLAPHSKLQFETKRLNYMHSIEVLENESIDVALIISMEDNPISNHLCREKIFTEEVYCCIKKDGELDRQTISENIYLSAKHIILRRQRTSTKGYLDKLIQSTGKQRDIIAITSSIITAILTLLKNENIIVSGPKSTLTYLSQFFPIVCHPLPFDNGITWDVIAVWHEKNGNDDGIHWLVEQLIRN